MDQKEFLEKFEQADAVLDKSRMAESIHRNIEENLKDGLTRGHQNMIIVMEELAELSKEVAKELRGKGDYYRLVEELADVKMCIEYVQNICDIPDTDINKALNVKVDRLNDVLNKMGYFQ